MTKKLISGGLIFLGIAALFLALTTMFFPAGGPAAPSVFIFLGIVFLFAGIGVLISTSGD